jgi:hypothetical protein
MEVGKPIWNTFHVGKFFQISTDFEFSKDYTKTDLNELWSNKLIEILIANPSTLHFGQGVLHGDLQRLDYDLGIIHTLTLNSKEDIEFQKGINVK